MVIKYRKLVIYVENGARRETIHLPIRGAEFARAHIIRVVRVCLIQKIFIKPIVFPIPRRDHKLVVENPVFCSCIFTLSDVVYPFMLEIY